MTCRKALDGIESRLCKQLMISLAEIRVMAGWHPAHRQHERKTGSGVEPGNLSPQWQESRDARGALAT